MIQIEISKNYAYADWLEDLKRVLMSAGAVGKSTVFLFNDTQVRPTLAAYSLLLVKHSAWPHFVWTLIHKLLSVSRSRKNRSSRTSTTC